MAVYMVQRHLPGITMEQLASAKGRPVRHIRSTSLPQEDRCMCLFEAVHFQLVQEVNDIAGIPYTRVAEVRDLTP